MVLSAFQEALTLDSRGNGGDLEDVSRTLVEVYKKSLDINACTALRRRTGRDGAQCVRAPDL